MLVINPKLALLTPTLLAATRKAHDDAALNCLRAATEHMRAAAELERAAIAESTKKTPRKSRT